MSESAEQGGLISASDITPGESVESVKELVQTERTRQIFRRREEVSEALAKGDTVRLVHDASRQEVDVMIESRVRAYALALGPLMRRCYDSRVGGEDSDRIVETNYWEEEPEIKFKIAPPQNVGGEWEGMRDGTRTVKNPDESEGQVAKPVLIEQNGVQFIANCSSPLSFVWSQEVKDGQSTSFQPVQREATIPRDAVLEVMQACDDFLAEIGLDLNPKGGEIDVGSEEPF